MSESWARRPVLRRQIRKRLEEIVPDKNVIAAKFVAINRFSLRNGRKSYIPKDLNSQLRRSIAFKKSQLFEDKFGVMIEGHSLHYVLKSKSMTRNFLKILKQCDAVIVCRASPS